MRSSSACASRSSSLASESSDALLADRCGLFCVLARPDRRKRPRWLDLRTTFTASTVLSSLDLRDLLSESLESSSELLSELSDLLSELLLSSEEEEEVSSDESLLVSSNEESVLVSSEEDVSLLITTR